MKRFKNSVLTTLVLVFFINISASGINKTDSLIQVTQSDLSDSLRIDAYLELSMSYIYTEIENTKLYADTALTLSSKINNPYGLAASNRLLGIYHLFVSDFAQSIHYNTLALEISEKNHFHHLLGSCYNNLGIIYRHLKAFDKALPNFYSALKIAEETKDTIFSIKAVLNIATLHRQMSNHDKALKHLFETQDLCIQQHDTLLMGNFYYEIGAVYNSMDEYEKAYEYCQKAIECFEHMDSWYNLSLSYSFMGTISSNLGKKKEAISYFDKSRKYYEQLGNKSSMVINYMEAGEVYRSMGDHKKAKEYANKAIDLANELDNILGLDVAYNTLQKIAESEHNYKEAYKYSLMLYELQDSIYDVNRNEQIENLEIIYETEKKEKAIELLKKDKIILDKESNIRKLQRNAAIIGALVCLVVLVLLANRYKLRRRLFAQKEAKLLAEARYKEEEALRREEELRAKAEINKLNAEMIQEELDHRNREITSSALYVAQKNEILGTISEKLDELKSFIKVENEKDLIQIKRLIKDNIELDEDWNNFKLHFEKVHPKFFETLSEKYPELTTNEQKICAYLRMNLSGKEIARLLNITPKSAQMSRYRLKKKFDLSADEDLMEFIKGV